MEKTIELEELSEFHIAKYAISDFTYLINIKSSLQAPSILRDRVGMTYRRVTIFVILAFFWRAKISTRNDILGVQEERTSTISDT